MTAKHSSNLPWHRSSGFLGLSAVHRQPAGVTTLLSVACLQVDRQCLRGDQERPIAGFKTTPRSFALDS
jgi:hypothetical protein